MTHKQLHICAPGILEPLSSRKEIQGPVELFQGVRVFGLLEVCNAAPQRIIRRRIGHLP
jgi:hypothetical protein